MNASLDTLFQAPVLPDPVESPSTSRADSRPTSPRDGPDFRDTFSAVHQQQRAALDDQRERSEIADARRKRDDGERPLPKSEGVENNDEDAGEDLKAQRKRALAARGALREIPLGRGSTLLVAGAPPTDAELLDFAKAAGLPETAVTALLLGVDGQAKDPQQPDLDGIPAESDEWSELELETPNDMGPGGLDGILAGEGHDVPLGLTADDLQDALMPEGTNSVWAPTSTSSSGMLTPIPTSAGLAASTQTALRAALLGDGLDANGVAVATEGVSGEDIAADLGAFVAHRIRVPVLDPQAATVWSHRAEQSMAGEGIRLDPLVLRSVVFEKMTEAAAPMPTAADRLASLQAADLGASQPLDMADPDVDRIAGDLAPGGTSRLGGAALGSSTGDGGQGRQANQQLAQRFGELMSQRLVQQISQGNWKVNMDVHPRALGDIQIELQWKGGELEASFRASQLATRDLLQEALPRLRETLERAGTDVASLTVGDASRQKNGDQTGHNRNRSEQLAVQSGDDQPVAVVEGLTPRTTPSDGRLDVLV